MHHVDLEHRHPEHLHDNLSFQEHCGRQVDQPLKQCLILHCNHQQQYASDRARGTTHLAPPHVVRRQLTGAPPRLTPLGVACMLAAAARRLRLNDWVVLPQALSRGSLRHSPRCPSCRKIRSAKSSEQKNLPPPRSKAGVTLKQHKKRRRISKPRTSRQPPYRHRHTYSPPRSAHHDGDLRAARCRPGVSRSCQRDAPTRCRRR